MALTAAQKANTRRHLEYPVIGLLTSSPAGGSLASAFAGYRFLQSYGRLEWKLNNLQPVEEAMLTGLAYGALALIGPSPNPGNTISVTLQGGGIASPQTLTAVAQAGDSAAVLLTRMVAVASANTVLQAAGVLCVSPMGTGPFNQNQLPLAEIAFEAPVPFQILNPVGTGVLVPQITATGTLQPPTTSLDGATTTNGYLPILDGLEGAWASASQNLDTSAAGPWKGRMNEIGQRLVLYRNWQLRLSSFLEIPLYDGTAAPKRRDYVNTMRYA